MFDKDDMVFNDKFVGLNYLLFVLLNFDKWVSEWFVFFIFSGFCYIYIVLGEFFNYWKNWVGVLVIRIFNFCVCLFMCEFLVVSMWVYFFIVGIIEIISKVYDFLMWWIV